MGMVAKRIKDVLWLGVLLAGMLGGVHRPEPSSRHCWRSQQRDRKHHERGVCLPVESYSTIGLTSRDTQLSGGQEGMHRCL